MPAWIPDGQVLSVHPTMLYSALALVAVAGLLWMLRRQPWRPGRLFGLYLVLGGIERFAVEFLRAKDDRLLAALTTAQGVALVSVVVGIAVILARWRTVASERMVDPAAAD